MQRISMSCLDAPRTMSSRACANEETDAITGSELGGVAAPRFSLPAVVDVPSFCRETVNLVRPQHGTTTLGFIFRHF